MKKTSLTDYAVYWNHTHSYDINGRPQIESTEGTEIKCRWENIDSSSQEEDTENIKLIAEVFVDRDIPEGSLMWHGRLEDWPGSDIDAEDPRLGKVVSYEKVPGLKGRSYTRSVKLMRYSDTLAGTP